MRSRKLRLKGGSNRTFKYKKPKVEKIDLPITSGSECFGFNCDLDKEYIGLTKVQEEDKTMSVPRRIRIDDYIVDEADREGLFNYLVNNTDVDGSVENIDDCQDVCYNTGEKDLFNNLDDYKNYLKLQKALDIYFELSEEEQNTIEKSNLTEPGFVSMLLSDYYPRNFDDELEELIDQNYRTPCFNSCEEEFESDNSNNQAGGNRKYKYSKKKQRGGRILKSLKKQRGGTIKGPTIKSPCSYKEFISKSGLKSKGPPYRSSVTSDGHETYSHDLGKAYKKAFDDMGTKKSKKFVQKYLDFINHGYLVAQCDSGETYDSAEKNYIREKCDKAIPHDVLSLDKTKDFYKKFFIQYNKDAKDCLKPNKDGTGGKGALSPSGGNSEIDKFRKLYECKSGSLEDIQHTVKNPKNPSKRIPQKKRPIQSWKDIPDDTDGFKSGNFGLIDKFFLNNDFCMDNQDKDINADKFKYPLYCKPDTTIPAEKLKIAKSFFVLKESLDKVYNKLNNFVNSYYAEVKAQKEGFVKHIKDQIKKKITAEKASIPVFNKFMKGKLGKFRENLYGENKKIYEEIYKQLVTKYDCPDLTANCDCTPYNQITNIYKEYKLQLKKISGKISLIINKFNYSEDLEAAGTDSLRNFRAQIDEKTNKFVNDIMLFDDPDKVLDNTIKEFFTNF